MSTAFQPYNSLPNMPPSLAQSSAPAGEGKGSGHLRTLDQKRSRHQYIKPLPQLELADDRHAHGTDSADLSSLFDFDSPLNAGAPKKLETSEEPCFEYQDGWDSLNLQPLSPPGSAVYPVNSWQPLDHNQQAPHNILTHIDPSRARAQYGQTTPPDDEQFSSLDSELLMQERQESSAVTKDPLNASKRKQISSAPDTNAPTQKRLRKNVGRGSKSSLDLSNPEDCRRSKFLERNRVAASKCRQKKKEWTNNIESQARQLQKDNTSLRQMVDSCKEEILFLKGEMLKHGTCGNSEIQEYLQGGVHNFHGLPSAIIKQETSPLCTAPPSPALSAGCHAPAPSNPLDSAVHDRKFSEESRRRSSVNDEILEQLLKNHFVHDTSDDGIERRLVR